MKYFPDPGVSLEPPGSGSTKRSIDENSARARGTVVGPGAARAGS